MHKPPCLLNLRSAAKRRVLLFVVAALFLAASAHASCGGLTSVQESTELVYPPIARAAHIDGVVILLARFDLDGRVKEVSKVLGPEMLQKAATAYVQGLKANSYSGPRQCPMVITFRAIGAYAECGTPEDDSNMPIPPVERPDTQHIIITHRGGCNYVTRDPGGKRIYRFHL